MKGGGRECGSRGDKTEEEGYSVEEEKEEDKWEGRETSSSCALVPELLPVQPTE